MFMSFYGQICAFPPIRHGDLQLLKVQWNSSANGLGHLSNSANGLGLRRWALVV